MSGVSIEDVVEIVSDWIHALEEDDEPKERIEDAYKALRLLAGISDRPLTEAEKGYALKLRISGKRQKQKDSK